MSESDGRFLFWTPIAFVGTPAARRQWILDWFMLPSQVSS